jgi:hypothetical protein
MASQDAGSSLLDLAAVVQHIASAQTAQDLLALAHTLRTFAPDEQREHILAGVLPGAQDPLPLLNIHANTLGVLYILYATHKA